MHRFRLLTATVALALAPLILPLRVAHADQPPAATFRVEVADISKGADLVRILQSRGIAAALVPPNDQVIDEQNNSAVWIGRNVPLDTVRTTLREAMRVYPHLTYFYVVGDRGEAPPERVHYTIHVGGSIEAVLVMKLNPIDRQELANRLATATTVEELHRYLHERNRVQGTATERAK